MPRFQFSRALLAIGAGVCLTLAAPAPAQDDSGAGEDAEAPDASELRERIEAAEPHSTVTYPGSERLMLHEPLVIKKPLTFRGLKARIPEGEEHLGVIIQSRGVEMTHFDIIGNGLRPAGPIKAGRGGFVIRNGRVAKSGRHGIWNQGEINGGLVRDIVSRDMRRDTVSLVGRKPKGRNLVIENIRAPGSDIRGALEIADGCEKVVARNIYAEDCVYAVSVEDDGEAGCDVNTDVRLEGIVAVDCKLAITTRGDKKAKLTDYTIAGNVARVDDPIKGARRRVEDNAAPGSGTVDDSG